jgi:hypothetical protein
MNKSKWVVGLLDPVFVAGPAKKQLQAIITLGYEWEVLKASYYAMNKLIGFRCKFRDVLKRESLLV